MSRFNTVSFSTVVAIILLVVISVTVFAKDEVIILEAKADATIFAVGAAASGNFGGRVRIRSGVWRNDGQDRRTRTLIRFDLSELSTGLEIVKAELRLTRDKLANAGKGTVQIAMYKLLKDWNEGDGDGATDLPGTATWLHSSFPVTWAAPGADGVNVDRVAKASSVIAVTTDPVQVWTGLEADVKAWYEGKEANYGWVMASLNQEQAAVSFDSWYSKEAEDINVRPILVLTVRKK